MCIFASGHNDNTLVLGPEIEAMKLVCPMEVPVGGGRRSKEGTFYLALDLFLKK